RDDSNYQPPQMIALPELRGKIMSITPADRAEGNARRISDLVDRLHDQIIAPMRNDRRAVDRLVGALRGMQSPGPQVDVNPITQQLQRRLQERSVLYLIGPARVLDRVRQVPSMLARLPRTTWDLLSGAGLS